MKRNLYLIIFTIGFLFNCKFDDRVYFNDVVISDENILIESIQIDSILIKGIESSFSGYTVIYDSSIYFIDSRFCWIYQFDKKGKKVNRWLGQGKGPFEINTAYIDAFCFFGKHKLFIGSSYDCHIFNENWQRIGQYTINWQWKYKDIDKISDPDPNERSLYTFEYEKFNLKEYDGDIFAPIYSQHHTFHPFSTKYYKEGAILAKFNVKKGLISDIFGRRSRRYLNYNYLAHHSFFSYDINHKGDFFINHEIDPLIYVYGRDYNIKYAFGNSGIDMDTSYTEIKIYDIRNKKELKKYANLYFEDKPKKGYYSDIKLFDDIDILFRSYKKGYKSDFDGLQIYHNTTLIADLNVPKNFVVIGKIGSMYYCKGIIDEEKEEIKLYTFQLPQISLNLNVVKNEK